MALVIGNQDGIDQIMQRDPREFWRLMTLGFSAAGAARKVTACIYIANANTLQEISKIDNLQYLVWIGHGAEGNLIARDRQTITPENTPTFSSSQIKRVTFMSCQAGQKNESWKSVFKNSPQATLQLNPNNIRVDDATYTLLSTWLDDFVDCKI